MDAHTALQQTYPRVEQDGLQLAGHPGIAQCHIHRQGLVPAVDVGGAGRFVDFLSGQRLPNRRPLGAGRGDDVVNTQVAEGFQDGVSAVFC